MIKGKYVQRLFTIVCFDMFGYLSFCINLTLKKCIYTLGSHSNHHYEDFI